jgi:hypothetical protein
MAVEPDVGSIYILLLDVLEVVLLEGDGWGEGDLDALDVFDEVWLLDEEALELWLAGFEIELHTAEENFGDDVVELARD